MFCSCNPSCPHGPTLLFQDVIKGETRQFFACSAYRSKKFCEFHHERKDKITSGKLLRWQEARRALLRNKDHIQLYKELIQFQSGGGRNGRFCQTCGRLVTKGPKMDSHDGHVLVKLDAQLCTTPTKVLRPLSENKKEAQYFFSPETVRFLIGLLKSLRRGSTYRSENYISTLLSLSVADPHPRGSAWFWSPGSAPGLSYVKISAEILIT